VSTEPVKQDPTKVPGYCGPCYGGEGKCCNTCDEVKAAYRYTHGHLYVYRLCHLTGVNNHRMCKWNSQKGWALGSLEQYEQCVWSGQTGEETMRELERGDGCQMFGYLEVNKVRSCAT
jgi:hypothetical protein